MTDKSQLLPDAFTDERRDSDAAASHVNVDLNEEGDILFLFSAPFCLMDGFFRSSFILNTFLRAHSSLTFTTVDFSSTVHIEGVSFFRMESKN